MSGPLSSDQRYDIVLSLIHISLAPEHAVAGCREVLDTASRYLCQITGMDGMTFQPAAGAHGEFPGALLIKQYHDARGRCV